MALGGAGGLRGGAVGYNGPGLGVEWAVIWLTKKYIEPTEFGSVSSPANRVLLYTLKKLKIRSRFRFGVQFVGFSAHP